MKKEEKKKLANTRSVFVVYWNQAKNHPYTLIGVLVSVVLTQVTSLVSPLFMRQFFNQLSSSAQEPTPASALYITLGLIGAAWILDWVFSQMKSVFNQRFEAKVMERLYNTSFDYLLRHSHQFFTSNFTGSLVHKTGKFSRAFEVLFDSIATQFFPTFLFIIGATAVLYLRSSTLGLILAVWIMLFTCLQVYLSRLKQPIRTSRAAADSKMTGALSDAVSNQSTISLFAATSHEAARFRETVRQWRTATLRSWSADDWTQGLLSLLMTFIQLGLMFGAIIFWTQGLLTVGDFYLIQAYLLGTFNRLIGINYTLRRFYDAYTDAAEMVYILKTPHDVVDIPKAKHLRVPSGAVQFSDVEFHFNENTSILNDFNLTIQGGEKVAFVGPSGAGKSTVTKLLLRLYNVAKGTISIDNQNIAMVSQDSLREAIAFVPQEPVLFHRSLLENIRYGKPNASEKEVLDAAKKAHCHEFISRLPDAYETMVGERGIKLSGGERQRVAIARAILKNAPILILDEATSSLDSESEQYIQEALEVLMRGKTVMVIAHRLSTIMKMDRIVVLEGGKIVADGTHDELLKKDGLYNKLWSIQAGGFIAPDADAPELKIDSEEAESKEEIAQ